jgi:hypothetical protein
MPKQPSRPVEHEGAEESAQPDEPTNREVITPDWVELEKDEATPPATRPAPGGKRAPAIDRHR